MKNIQVTKTDAKKTLRFLQHFGQKNILVIGDVGVDRYRYGVAERLSPEAPVPIVRVLRMMEKLGLAANVADNLKALGAGAYLIGVVGKDTMADRLKSMLRHQCIHDLLLVDTKRLTACKERIVVDTQQLLRVDEESTMPLSKKLLRELHVRLDACQVDAVILQDYAKGMLSVGTQALIERIRERGLFVAIDPHPTGSLSDYQNAHLLTPNTKEAEALVGQSITDETSLVRVGELIMKKTHAEHLVITRGKDGMALFSKKSKVVKLMPTFAREVYDVSGAGDTVISVLTLALVSGASLEEAAFLANTAAGLEVAKHGTAIVSQGELRSALTIAS